MKLKPGPTITLHRQVDVRKDREQLTLRTADVTTKQQYIHSHHFWIAQHSNMETCRNVN